MALLSLTSPHIQQCALSLHLCVCGVAWGALNKDAMIALAVARPEVHIRVLDKGALLAGKGRDGIPLRILAIRGGQIKVMTAAPCQERRGIALQEVKEIFLRNDGRLRTGGRPQIAGNCRLRAHQTNGRVQVMRHTPLFG